MSANVFLDAAPTTGSETLESIEEQEQLQSLSCAAISERRPHKKENRMIINNVVLDLEKSILLAIPTATGSQSVVVRLFCNNLRATVTKTHRRILWLTGPRGCGKHFLFTAWYRGIKGAGMLSAYIEGAKANGESRSYYALFQDLDQQLVDQHAGELPAELNPRGRSETELQSIFGELIRLCSEDIVNVIVTIPDTNVADAVRFVADIKSLAQEHNNIVVSALIGDSSEAKEQIEAHQFANDPREEMLQLGLPSISEYKQLARTFADSFEHAINNEAAGLCAAQATKIHAPPSYIRKLITETAKYTDFEITPDHIAIALKALDFKPLEPLKEPVAAVPILQAYASLYLAEQKTKRIPDRETIFVPVSALRATYEFLTLDKDIPTHTPTEFEEYLQDHIQRETFSLNAKDHTVTLNPKFCYSSYLDHILSWDYRDILEKAQVGSPNLRQQSYEDSIEKLSIGHLVALHTMLSLKEAAPDTLTISQVYPHYVEACNDIGIAPVKRNPGFWKLVASLAAKKLIRTKRKGRVAEIVPQLHPFDYPIVQDRVTALTEQIQSLQHVNTVTRTSKNGSRTSKNGSRTSKNGSRTSKNGSSPAKEIDVSVDSHYSRT